MNSGTKKRILVTIVCVGAAAAVGVVLVGSRKRLMEAIYPPSSTSRTTSMDLVDIALHNEVQRTALRLRVPNAYMVLPKNWRGGDQELIVIETQLPDLKPAPFSPEITGAPGSAEHEHSMRRFRNGVTLDLWAKNADVDHAIRYIQRELANEERRIGISRKFDELIPGVGGLRSFRELACRPAEAANQAEIHQGEVCTDAHYEHYFAELPGSYLHMQCAVWDRDTLGYRLGCGVTSAFRGHALNYVMRYSELHRWREFHDGVNTLLESFLVGQE